MFDKQSFKDYFSSWLDGIQNELYFWDNYMRKHGGIYFYSYEDVINPQKKFALENDIPDNLLGRELNYIDVGSGPFSRCGFQTDKVRLKSTIVDPLAEAYKTMKTKYNINNEVNIQTGFVEFLDRYYPENTFDIVHMSNSLDHSFDPVWGIFQLLYICKIDGVVILRHSQNEAVNENYDGLHQWNLCVENDKFFIWRHNDRIDVTEMLGDYAEISLRPNEREDDWIYNKVILKKKNDIKLPYRDYYHCAFDMIYKKMLSIMMDESVKNCGCESNFEKLLDCINIFFHNPKKYKRIKNMIIGYDFVDIYGMGVLGESIYRLLEKYEEKIGDIIDCRQMVFRDKKTIRIEEYNPIGRRLLIVTAWSEKSENTMIDEIRKHSFKVEFITIYDLLNQKR